MWQTVNLGEVVNIVAGQSPKGENYNKNGIGMPFYQGKKGYGDRYLKPPSVWTTEIKTTANSGDVLMSVRAPVGAVNITTEAICIGRGLFAFQANSSIDRNYLYYFLLVTGEKLEGNAGAIFNSINKKQIENINIHLPPLVEQQRIVEKLNAVSEIIENSKKQIKQYQALKSVLLANELGAKNDDWQIVKLAEIVEISMGKTPPRNNPKMWDKEKISNNVWLSIADLTASKDVHVNDSKEYVSDEWAKLSKEVPANTLIMSFKLSIGKLAITGSNLRTNEAIAAFEIKNKDSVTNEYLLYYLYSLNWDKIVGGDIKVKGKTLNKAKLKELPALLPPLAEQKRIVAKLDNVDKMIKNKEKQIEQYQVLLSVLLASELKGEVA